uniref:F-box domain-containing protein n=1 Tax=Coccidioides posadasii RMSCC 3488 TaxID=454284 RepID=A0A0J6IAV7_COCPO|nr:F-box domain-containing protein [Coccidioides posadasii RMSCC 3488]
MDRLRPLELLDLPPELLQLILFHCSTPSFLQLSSTCQTLYTIASSCREVIKNHLKRTPGARTSLNDLKTEELFRVLKARTAEHLYGANFHSDLTNYIFKCGIIDNCTSALREGEDPNAALVEKGGSRVLLYHIQSKEAKLRSILEVPYDQPGRVEVIKTVFCKDGSLAVLQKYEPIEESCQAGRAHPFAKEALESYRQAEFHLVTYPDISGFARVPRVTVGVLQPVEGFHPTAIDVQNPSMAVIAWQHERYPLQGQVLMYTLVKDASVEEDGRTYAMYSSKPIIDADPASNILQCIPPIVRLELNDNASQVLYYHPSSTLYNRYGDLLALDTAAQQRHSWMKNACNVTLGHRLLRFSIGIPFFCTHETYQADSYRQMCRWQYLTLGIARHESEKWTIACLLRSEARCRSSRCQHVPNLDRGRRFNQWVAMARLWGYQNSESSLSGLVATSPRGKRIAIANWNVIYIWALNPQVIIEGQQGKEWEYYPENMKSEHGFVELKPIVLQPDAVCFNLKFSQSEDELIALTDRGLMRWDLGPAGKGFKVKKFLDMDAKISMGETSKGTGPAVGTSNLQDVGMIDT